MKKVSVIIPFYSNKEWLREALGSVFEQTYTNYEIILVNDGSKEDISDILEEHGNRIVYIYQENAGPAAARNLGIRHASGDYIAFEDSDDIWLSTKLEKQVDFMERTKVRWCHVGFNYWWPKTGRTKLVNSSRDYDNVYLQRLVSTKIATPAVMLDRSIYNEGDFFFPEDIRNGEDGILFTMLAKRYPLGLIQEPLVNVRMRGDNSQTHAVERFNLKATNYKRWVLTGENLPIMVHIIYTFYCVYAKILGKESNPIKEKFAKCLWVFPYVIERFYVRYLYRHTSKSEKYILRYG